MLRPWLIVVSFIVIVLAPPAFAEFRTIFDTEDGWLNVRQGPSTSDPVIERLFNGQSVFVTERQGNWAKIDYDPGGYNPSSGWIYYPRTQSVDQFLSRSAANFSLSMVHEISRFCHQPLLQIVQNYPQLSRVCSKSFYCGDGGCDPLITKFVIDESNFNRLVSDINDFMYQEISRCGYDTWSRLSWEFYPFSSSFDQDEWVHIFCLESFPGYEIENTLRLRELDYVTAAARIGGDAGAPPRMINIDQEAFERFRGRGIGDLRMILVSSIEAAIGHKCETTDTMTCSVLPQGGKLVVELLVPGSDLSGRPDHWEKSHWEVFTHWDGSMGNYQLYFGLPITSIRRWPTSGVKPFGGFVSLDYDEGFESVRTFVMTQVADAIDAELSEEY